MFGVCFTSIGVMELLINRNRFHVCVIEKGNNPETILQEFLNTRSGGRMRVVLVDGYSTLKVIKNHDSNIKFIIFDAPQILVRQKVEIYDSSPPMNSSGVWNLYKRTPDDFNKKIEDTSNGFDIKKEETKFTFKGVVKSCAADLQKSGNFKRMVAKYVCGMVKNETWNEKIILIKKFISEEKFNMLLEWLSTFAPDALWLAYMDCVIHAPKRCKLYAEAIEKDNMTPEIEQKFKVIATRSCQTADANIEDFLYLCRILPPDPDYKFLFSLPKYVIKFRKKFPLIKFKNAENKIDRNT